MSLDRTALQSWYREAMGRRSGELKALRGPLQAEERRAFDQARSIGQALRGSGATFGFPDLTAVATLLETSRDEAALRRVEGLISQLVLITEDAGDEPSVSAEWLLRAADLPVDSGLLGSATDLRHAWELVRGESGLDESLLARAVARYLDLDVADLSAPGRSALRLVPEALMAAGRVVPLREDAASIVVATYEPTSLPMELELKRVTGREPVFVVASPSELHSALASLLDHAPTTAEPVRPSTAEADLSEKSVLVVDDEPSARHLLRSLLERKGFEVFEAEDGLEALERVEERSTIGLVVADLNMPRMDGLELIWELRGDQRRAHLPVIVVTGEVDEILEMQLLEEGADDYIRKPVDARVFMARVEATIRRHED